MPTRIVVETELGKVLLLPSPGRGGCARVPSWGLHIPGARIAIMILDSLQHSLEPQMEQPLQVTLRLVQALW